MNERQTERALGALSLPQFGAALAPIEAKVSWEGSTWTVAFRILSASEELAVLEAAAAGHPDARNYREEVETLILAVAGVEGEPVTYSAAERRRWVLGDGSADWPGWAGPFIAVMMDGYTRAKHAIITSRERVAADPLFFSLPAEASGDDSVPLGTSPDAPSPPTSAPTSSDIWSETSMSGARSDG